MHNMTTMKRRQRWALLSLTFVTLLLLTAVHISHPTGADNSSTEQPAAQPWAPYRISTCERSIPETFAPCQALKLRLQHCTYAEELVYPDFAIGMPDFASDEHRRRFEALVLQDLNGRGSLERDRQVVVYRGQHGQNYVFEHAALEHEAPFDEWSDRAAMGGRVSPSIIHPLNPISDPPAQHGTVLLADAPDSWAFQHFIDRSARVIAQAWELVEGDEDLSVVTGRTGQGPVREMWQLMGFPKEKVINQPSGPVSARRIVWSSRAVLIHPWLSRVVSLRLGLDPDAASATRNKIMYISRSMGDTLNGGRQVINEAAVLAAITELLSDRGQGEELVIFDRSSFATQKELMLFFNLNVKAIVGPHGGGMMNHRFMARQTFMLEMFPTTWPVMENFEETGVMDQRYAAMVLEPVEGTATDMEADPKEVVELLERGLSSTESRLEAVYPWVL